MAEDLILIISIVAALGIGLVGGLVYSSVFGSATRRTRALEEEVDTLKRDQSKYKQQVNQHFKKTANLFEGLTEQYKAIYSHLAEGSETLCSENTTPPALDLPEKPRLAEKAEQAIIDDKKSDSSTEDSADGEDEIHEKKVKAAQSEESENLMGDAPNIPEVPGEETDQPKIH